MYALKLHKKLTAEKWAAYSRAQQILMIANELQRAKNFIAKKQYEACSLCYERAFELTDMTCADIRWRGKLKELRRFRELLAQLYVSDKKDERKNDLLYMGLLRLSSEAYRTLFPAKYK